jgi:hypothetical protein
MTDRMTRAAFLNHGGARATRNLGIRCASRVPTLESKLTLWVSGLKRSPYGEALSAGTPFRPGLGDVGRNRTKGSAGVRGGRCQDRRSEPDRGASSAA